MDQLTALEIASGLPLGFDPGTPGLPEPRSGTSALQALERALVPALERSPCVVAFSGGRDSSAMLAVAVNLARREGLPEPVAVTERFQLAPRTDEREWQELVIAHLGISQWEVLEFTDELDLLGPYARESMRAHGLLYPANAVSQVPVYELARGGSAITGLDGDSAFGGWQWKLVDELLARPWRARRAHLKTAASALLPGAIRERRAARRSPTVTAPAWLRPDAARTVRRRWAQQHARQPVGWRARIEHFSRLRYLALTRRTLDLLANDHDVKVIHPILDPYFLAALGAEWRPGRFSSRTAVMRHLFGDLLPGELIERRSKAEFGFAYLREQSREFARSWDGGSGLDPDLIDPERLRSAWLEDERIDFRCSSALQAAWLAIGGEGA